MILAEHADQHFELPATNFAAPYMQYAIPCTTAAQHPGVAHVDGTSRVQTVHRAEQCEDSGPRRLLEAWHSATGCAMLLNTSLNIKGEPLVNTREDAQRWTATNGVTVHMPKEKQ
jgi:carbamoyltransferase